MKWRKVIPGLLLTAASMGCGSGSNDGRQAPLTTSTAATAEEAATEEADAKRRWREPATAETTNVSWSEAARHPRIDPQSLPAQEQAKLDSITLPVLLPSEPALLGQAVLTHGPAWYAAALTGDAHHVTLHGTRVAIHQPGLRGELEAVERPPVRISRTHGIVTASFEAFGVAYTVDVECHAPTSDSRCTEDAYVRGLVDGLGVAGGTPAPSQGATR